MLANLKEGDRGAKLLNHLGFIDLWAKVAHNLRNRERWWQNDDRLERKYDCSGANAAPKGGFWWTLKSLFKNWHQIQRIDGQLP